MRGARGAVQAGIGAFALAGLAAVFGCEPGLAERRDMLCRRAVPALAPEGSRVRLLRVGRGASRDSVRVDYSIAGSEGAVKGEAGRARFLVCVFGPGADLTALATERGPVGGAALYMLKRYYLETPEAEAADPARSPGAAPAGR